MEFIDADLAICIGLNIPPQSPPRLLPTPGAPPSYTLLVSVPFVHQPAEKGTHSAHLVMTYSTDDSKTMPKRI